MPIENNVFLYESFAGAGLIDNPYAIFLELKKRSDFDKYTHVWVLRDFRENNFNFIEYAGCPNVKFVKYGSDDYLKYISIAKVLINNCTFPTYWTKKQGQIYINTWHGLPRKKLGYDVANSNIDMANTIRNFLCADSIISYDNFTTKIYKESYKLKELCEEKILQVGAPRVTILSQTKRRDIIQKLHYAGINIDPNKKIILYAPTWRGTLSQPRELDVKQIVRTLSRPGYQVLVKKHHVNYENSPFYVPSSIDINELMSICDILVTDYSSAVFDWIYFNRPVIYYAPDIESYKKKPGLYFDFECAPATNLEMLDAYISNIDAYWDNVKDSFLSLRANLSQYYNFNAMKIIEAIFENKPRAQRKTKTKLLFYAGDFKPNGVTSSFLSLLNNIDYDKYDVSVIALKKTDPSYLGKINSINRNARVLTRAGTYAQTLLEHCANNIVLKKGIGTPALKEKLPEELYRREWRRCFGDTQFDILINFTGYSPFYSYFFVSAPLCARRIIWQHNIMKQDAERPSSNLRELLYAVFSTYPYYDKIVSVSELAFKQNAIDFPEYKDKMYVVHNTIDVERIESLAQKDNGIKVDLNKINFVNVARLSYAKNQIQLILAFKDFNEKYCNEAELYIIGDGELREEIEAISTNLPYIHIVGYNSNPFNTICKCSAFIFPSIYEGQGLAPIEASVLGISTIVTNLGEIRGVTDGTQDVLIQQPARREQILQALIDYTLKDKHVDSFDAEEYNNLARGEFEGVIDEYSNLWHF